MSFKTKEPFESEFTSDGGHNETQHLDKGVVSYFLVGDNLRFIATTRNRLCNLKLTRKWTFIQIPLWIFEEL